MIGSGGGDERQEEKAQEEVAGCMLAVILSNEVTI
jgi:hypothetical protein